VLIGRTIPSADVAAALRAHGPVLLAAARTMTTNEADAQDLVPATFEIGLRSLPSLMDCGAMRYWLLRIEVREAIRMTGRLRRFVRRTLAFTRLLRPTRRRTDSSQTAEALGVSDNTIKSELKTGLARLRASAIAAGSTMRGAGPERA
jgi:DNA-directed RNA polymerase specialized sigma24 family protein